MCVSIKAGGFYSCWRELPERVKENQRGREAGPDLALKTHSCAGSLQDFTGQAPHPPNKFLIKCQNEALKLAKIQPPPPPLLGCLNCLNHSLLLPLTRLRTIVEMPTDGWLWQFCELSHKMKCWVTFLSLWDLYSHSSSQSAATLQPTIAMPIPLRVTTPTNPCCCCWDSVVCWSLCVFKGWK